ncbi:MAG: hypothetical protein HKP01_02410, partial [Gemmatimonadetes bacterium]|nr:hypothetical protein [Gemmatimonadota bacterium]
GLALMLGALTWRAVRYALVFPMWGDEGMLAVNFHDRTFLGLLDPLDYGQVAPPGFLWLELGAAKLLGFTEPVLRLVPFLAGVGAVLLFWRLSRKLLDDRSALMAMAVFAASFYPTRYAAEVKPYSLDLLLALAIVLAAWAVYERPAVARRWAALAALASVCSWLSYPSIFVSGGACLWLLTAESGPGGGRRWGRILAVGLLIVASFMAMYALAGGGQRAAAPASYWAAGFPPLSEPWKIPLWALDVHTGMMLAYPNGGHSGGSTVSFLLAVAGGVVLWRRRRPVLLLLLSPLPLMFVAAALQKYPYGASARVAQHIAPAACLLIGAGIVCALRKVLGPRRTIRAIPIAVLPFLVVVVAGIVRDVVRPYHSQADVIVRQLVSDLGDESESGDRWVVFASRDDSGHAPLYSRFVGMGGRIHFQVLAHAPGPVLWAPDPATLAVGGGGRTWLIAYGNRVFEPGRAELDGYVRRVSESVGGPAVVTRHDLPDGEWIEIVELPAK